MKRKRLRKLGRIRGIVEGRIVVEGELVPRLGEKVYDSSLNEVGVVLSILGPKNKFFIEVKPSKAESHTIGESLYIIES
ncbi:MAG TPA: hypothetical protein ENF33_06310 [Nitrososphaeria archaeon]|nr:MAG: hypothetical protein DRN68_09725 [Nitrososphaerota archaeon]HDJ67305.1 hypothetical protein [Nitrososphaeria archaeon]